MNSPGEITWQAQAEFKEYKQEINQEIVTEMEPMVGEAKERLWNESK